VSGELERLADVVPFEASRAQCMHADPTKSEKGMHAAEFDELVRGLGLKGPNREMCRLAFEASPAGFGRILDQARTKGRKPVALLVHLVTAGDHLAEEEPAAGDGAARPVANARTGCSHERCQYQPRCIYAGRET
jgi:hypothetical protein